MFVLTWCLGQGGVFGYNQFLLDTKVKAVFNLKKIDFTPSTDLRAEISSLKSAYTSYIRTNGLDIEPSVLSSFDKILNGYGKVLGQGKTDENNVICTLDYSEAYTFINDVRLLITSDTQQQQQQKQNALESSEPMTTDNRKKRNSVTDPTNLALNYKDEYFTFLRLAPQKSKTENEQKQLDLLGKLGELPYYKWIVLNTINTYFVLGPQLDSSRQLKTNLEVLKTRLLRDKGNFLGPVQTRNKHKLCSEKEILDRNVQPRLETQTEQEQEGSSGISRDVQDKESNNLESPTEISDLYCDLRPIRSDQQPTTDNKQWSVIANNQLVILRNAIIGLENSLEKIHNAYTTGSKTDINKLCSIQSTGIERTQDKPESPEKSLYVYMQEEIAQLIKPVTFCSTLKCYRLTNQNVIFQIKTGTLCLNGEEIEKDTKKYKCKDKFTLDPPPCQSANKPSKDCKFGVIDRISAIPYITNANTALLYPKLNFLRQNLNDEKMTIKDVVLDAASNSIKIGRKTNDTFFLSISEIVQKFDLQDSIFSKIQELILDSSWYDEIIIASAVISVIGLIIAALQFAITCIRNNSNIANVRIVRSRTSGNRERFEMVRNNRPDTN